MVRRVFVALAFCFGVGVAQASPAQSLSDLDHVPTAYMRHHGHYYGYRPVRVVRHHRPYRYGYYRRAHHPRYGYYRRAYHPRYGYHRRAYHPYRYGYHRP